MIPEHLQPAQRLLMAGQADEAEAWLSSHLASNPQDAAAYDLLANAYARSNRHEDAADAFRRAMDADPTEPSYAFRCAQALISLNRHAEAVACLEQVLKLRPDQLQPLRSLGASYFALARYDDAQRVFRRIVELRPRAAEGFINLARALMARRAFDEAAEAASTAIGIRPKQHEAWLTLGQVRQEQGRYEEAHEAFTNASERGGGARALAMTARLLERWRRPDEARDAAERALEASPDDHVAGRVLARLDQRSGSFDRALQRLDGLLDVVERAEERGHILIERGQALDRLEREEEAWASFIEGQGLLCPPESGARVEMEAFVGMLDRCGAWPHAAPSWPKEAPRGTVASDGPVFLVGFPRSGTTLTEQLLAAHPAFVTSDERPLLHAVIEEVVARHGGSGATYPECIDRLGDEDVAMLRDVYWRAARDWTPDFDPESETRLVDKQPYNTPHLSLIRRVFPESRVIVVLRDPRDACLSLLMQDVNPNQRMLCYPTLELAADVYARMMGGYLHHRDHIGLSMTEVRYEDLVEDLDAFARRLVEGAGADWDERVLNYREAAAGRRSQINVHSVTQGVYARARQRWRRYAGRFEAVQETLAPFIEAFGYESS
ncbi:MAG: sulfotransferase [Phycisphaerales bacterium]